MIKVQFQNFDLGSICVLGHVTGRSGVNYVNSRYRNGRHESDIITVERYNQIIDDVSRRWHLPMCRWVPFFVEVPDPASAKSVVITPDFKPAEPPVEKLLSEAPELSQPDFSTQPKIDTAADIPAPPADPLSKDLLFEASGGDQLAAAPSTVYAPDFSRSSLPEPEVTIIEETGTVIATHTDPPVEDLSKLPFFVLRKMAYAKSKAAGGIPPRIEKMKAPELIEFLNAA